MTAFFYKTCRKCSLALIFLLFLQSSQGQTDFSGLNAIIKRNEKILGKEYVVVVQKAGKNIFLKESEEFKLKTPGPIASSSKWLTAAMVMVLVDEGKINLDDPVTKYIPVFAKYMKGYITIRHCLSHTTGLDTEPAGILKIAQKSKFASLEEEVNNFASKKLIVDNPGEAFAYGGIGINIAGRVIEVVTKKTFDRVITEKLFRPMGMRTATFYNENGTAPNPSGGAVCSAFDYLNFMQMLLNKGIFNNKRILSEKAVQEMLTIQFPDLKVRYTPELAKGFKYALGAWVQERDDEEKGFVFSCPGLLGTWPWMDAKRNYVGIVFSKGLITGQTKELSIQVKEAVDTALDQ